MKAKYRTWNCDYNPIKTTQLQMQSSSEQKEAAPNQKELSCTQGNIEPTYPKDQ